MILTINLQSQRPWPVNYTFLMTPLAKCFNDCLLLFRSSFSIGKKAFAFLICLLNYFLVFCQAPVHSYDFSVGFNELNNSGPVLLANAG